MTPQVAIEQAKRNALLPVYAIVGDERVLRDRVVAAVRLASLGGGIAEFNVDTFIAGEASAEKIIGAARTVPMMAPRRFVLVRQIERWDSARDVEASEASEDAPATAPLDILAEYAKAPVPSTCMVLVGTKVDGRRRFAQIAKKQNFMVDCATLDTQSLIRFIIDEAKAKGHDIDRDSAELLAEIAGPDLSSVGDALERMSLYVGPQNPIDERAVAECVTRVRLADTWSLVAAVGKRDLATALQHLADAYDPRDRGLPLLGAMAWSMRQLAKYKAVVDGGGSVSQASAAAGAFQPQRMRELGDRSKQATARDIERWLLVLAETDLALKSSKRSPDAVLEEMLTRLCDARAR